MEVRDKLVEEGRAEPHHILPRSGWITFRFRGGRDVESAIELFRLSYEIAKERPTSGGQTAKISSARGSGFQKS